MDITTKFLFSPLWLLVGLLAFFVLTLLKVHLIWFIQPKLYDRTTTNIFKNYFANFFTVLGKRRLYTGTFNYLFRRHGDRFKIIEEIKNPIKKKLNILKGLTKFLQPYLLFAFVWTVIGIWIKSKLFYDALQISLGGIQEMIVYLDSIPFISFLKKYKLYIFFGYGIICVLIPILYKNEDSTSKLKKIVAKSLLILTLIANVSFFGAVAGNGIISESATLKKLEQEVTTIHNRIYRELAIDELTASVADEIEAENNTFLNESIALKNKIERKSKEVDKSYEKELLNSLNQIYQTFVSEYLIPDNIYAQYSTSYSKPTKPQSFSKNTSKTATSDDYFSNKKSWSKKRGAALAKEVEAHIAKRPVNETRKKLKKILTQVFDFGLSHTVDEIAEVFDFKSNKTLKKLITVLVKENYRERLVKRVVGLANYFSKKSNIAPDTKLASNYIPVNKTKLRQLRTEKNMQIVQIQNQYLKKTIEKRINTLKIELPSPEDIISEINNDFNLKLQNESEAIRVVNIFYKQNGFDHYLDPAQSLTSNIKRLEKQAYRSYFVESVATASAMKANDLLKLYSNGLKNQRSNLTLKNVKFMSGIIGVCGNAKICNKCGLPCVFPVCLKRRR